MGKEEIKLFLFAKDFYMQKILKIPHKLLGLINKFSKVSGYKTSTKSVAILYTESEQPNRKLGEKLYLKSKMFRNKLNE